MEEENEQEIYCTERETEREREREIMEAEESERILCVCACMSVTEIKCCTFYGYINIPVPK